MKRHKSEWSNRKGIRGPASMSNKNHDSNLGSDGFSTNRESKVSSKPTVFPRVSSDDVLRGYSKLIIEHDGEEYHLRLTSKGRLILTK
jgi:hemin uptake protein HemP